MSTGFNVLIYMHIPWVKIMCGEETQVCNGKETSEGYM